MSATGAGGAAGATAEVVVILLTAPDEDVAANLVTTLVEERLVACGNIVPGIQSIYRWQGALERAREVLVILKTTAARAVTVMERVSALHPYEVPEVLVLPLTAGHPAYLAWVAAECR